MDHTYTSMMSGVPAALLIWLGLIGVSAVAFALLAAVAGRARRKGSPTYSGGSAIAPVAGYVPRNEAMLRALAAAKAVSTQAPAPGVTDVLPAVAAGREKPAEAPKSDEQRFADELATAAARAGITAGKRQAEWESAQRAVDSAWNAYEEAENAARRAIRAAAFPTPGTPLTPAEYADRERYLHRAAQAAHARGELDTDQLIDALSHRNGFDPRLHPFEQDALLRRCTRDRLLRVYQEVAEAERVAWREADRALAAKRSLDREAAAAARNLAPLAQPVDASRRFGVRVPVLSLR